MNRTWHQLYKNNTLDVALTRENSDLVSDITVTDPALCNSKGFLAGDHYAVLAKLNCLKPKPLRKVMSFRKWRDINMDSFKHDLSCAVSVHEPEIKPEMVESFILSLSECLQKVANKHAPLFRKEISLRPRAPWYSLSLVDLKRDKRRTERRWLKTKLSVHHEIYREKSMELNHALAENR